MSFLSRRLGCRLAIAASALLAAPAFGGGPPGEDPIYGSFSATGIVDKKEVENGDVDQYQTMLDETFSFWNDHQASSENLSGTWKQKGAHYSANFSKSAKAAIKAQVPSGAKVKAKVKLSKLMPTEQELSGTLRQKIGVKFPGYKYQLTTKCNFSGFRLLT